MGRRFYKSDAVWFLAVLILVAAQFWFPERGGDLSTDTWSNTARGKRAFYLMSQQRTSEVSRNHDSLETLFLELDWGWSGTESPILCILGPTREPNGDEWSLILEWVNAGGNLLYATPAGTAEFEIPQLGISIGDETEIGKQLLQDALYDVQSELTDDDVDYAWREEASISSAAAETLMVFAGATQVVRQAYGDGEIVVVSGDSIFTNEFLAYEQNPLLAWRILESTGFTSDSEIIFDEYLNDSGTPKMMSILFEMPIRPVTLMALVLCSLYFWYCSHRFGPYLPESIEPRRNIVDHTDMLGNLMFSAREGSHALRLYLRQLVHDLGLKNHRGRERKLLEPIALRMGKDVEEIVDLFQSASTLVRSEECNRKAAAELIRELASVRKASLANH